MKSFTFILLLLVSSLAYATELRGIELSYGQGLVVYEYDVHGNLQKVVDRRKSDNRDYGDDSYVDYRHDKTISSRAVDDHKYTENYATKNMYCCRGDVDYKAVQSYSDNRYEYDNARHDDYKYSPSGARITEGYIHGRYADEEQLKNREEKISELVDLFKNKAKIPLSNQAKYDLAKIDDEQFQVAYDVSKMYGNAIIDMPATLSFLKEGVKEIDLSFETDTNDVSATTVYPNIIIRVNYYANQDHDFIYETVLHEFGHVLEYWLWGECLYVYKGHDDLAEEWLSISGWHRDSDGIWQNDKKGIVNEYAGEHPSEDFAESVFYFLNNKPLVNEKKEFLNRVLNVDIKIKIM